MSPSRHRLLVTGGAGFIGSNFIRQHLLVEEPEDSPVEFILCLDKLTYAGNEANLTDLKDRSSFNFVAGDIGDTELVSNLLSQHQINGVIHFAAESHVDRSIDSPAIFIETNVLGTLKLLDSCRHYWRSLDPGPKAAFRFLHVSTDEVFGSLRPHDASFSEETPYSPNSPYAASKAGSDHLVRAYFHTYGFPALTSNCSNNYGPYQFPEKLIPLMILNSLEEKPLPIYGDGGQIRDWLYVADHCRALRLILEKGRLGQVYLIGGLNEITNLDLVGQICSVLDEIRPRTGGRSYRELISFVQDRPGHDRRYAIDCTKLKKELGWAPRENFKSGLRQTIDWYLKEEEWCAQIKARKYNRARLGLEAATRPQTS